MGVTFEVDPADIDETPQPLEAPRDYVLRMARSKADCVSARHLHKASIVLAADTTVVMDNVPLGKPQSWDDGKRILTLLSGRTHVVMSAVCLSCEGSVSTELVETAVDFIPLKPELIEAYLNTPEPWDKAGAYGIQGLGGVFVRSLRGCYSNVVGLPMSQTWQLLSQYGVANTLEPCDE